MAATFANNVSEEKLSKIAGVAFILLGAMTIIDGIIS
jgi:putative Ca2+/H+ antiporter (TMEM165/GDT1 family)